MFQSVTSFVKKWEVTGTAYLGFYRKRVPVSDILQGDFELPKFPNVNGYDFRNVENRRIKTHCRCWLISLIWPASLVSWYPVKMTLYLAPRLTRLSDGEADGESSLRNRKSISLQSAGLWIRIRIHFPTWKRRIENLQQKKCMEINNNCNLINRYGIKNKNKLILKWEQKPNCRVLYCRYWWRPIT